MSRPMRCKTCYKQGVIHPCIACKRLHRLWRRVIRYTSARIQVSRMRDKDPKDFVGIYEEANSAYANLMAELADLVIKE